MAKAYVWFADVTDTMKDRGKDGEAPSRGSIACFRIVAKCAACWVSFMGIFV